MRPPVCSAFLAPSQPPADLSMLQWTLGFRQFYTPATGLVSCKTLNKLQNNTQNSKMYTSAGPPFHTFSGLSVTVLTRSYQK